MIGSSLRKWSGSLERTSKRKRLKAGSEKSSDEEEDVRGTQRRQRKERVSDSDDDIQFSSSNFETNLNFSLLYNNLFKFFEENPKDRFFISEDGAVEENLNFQKSLEINYKFE